MRRAYVLALLLSSCKEDPPQPADCPSGPDFEVLITALDAPLPADTLVSIEYGAGEDHYSYPDPGGHKALFCKPSDREGNPVPVGGQGGEGPLEAGSDGLGGAGGSSGFDAFACDLWSSGPATLTVETSMYPTETRELTAKKGKCVVETEIEIGPDDGGA